MSLSDQYSHSHSVHKHACSSCGYLVHAHTTCCPEHISMHAQSHTSTSSCIRHNQSFPELVPVPALDHGSGFVHAHAPADTLLTSTCTASSSPQSVIAIIPMSERVQILAELHTITKAQHASMYCNNMHNSLLFQHHDCSEHRPTDSTLDARALQQYVHTLSTIISTQATTSLHPLIHYMHVHTFTCYPHAQAKPRPCP